MLIPLSTILNKSGSGYQSKKPNTLAAILTFGAHPICTKQNEDQIENGENQDFILKNYFSDFPKFLKNVPPKGSTNEKLIISILLMQFWWFLWIIFIIIVCGNRF